MAEARTGSDAGRRSRQILTAKTLVFTIVILAIIAIACYVQTAIYNGPGVAGMAALTCLLAGLVFLLVMD